MYSSDVSRVNFYAAARSAYGKRDENISVSTLGELAQQLSGFNTELANLLPTCTFLVNGEACDDLNRKLLETDHVDVLPQFAGG